MTDTAYICQACGVPVSRSHFTSDNNAPLRLCDFCLVCWQARIDEEQAAREAAQAAPRRRHHPSAGARRYPHMKRKKETR